MACVPMSATFSRPFVSMATSMCPSNQFGKLFVPIATSLPIICPYSKYSIHAYMAIVNTPNWSHRNKSEHFLSPWQQVCLISIAMVTSLFSVHSFWLLNLTAVCLYSNISLQLYVVMATCLHSIVSMVTCLHRFLSP